MGSGRNHQEGARRLSCGVKLKALECVVIMESQSIPMCLRGYRKGTAGKSESCNSPYGCRLPAHISFFIFRKNNYPCPNIPAIEMEYFKAGMLV